jgi:hypothetical protein
MEPEAQKRAESPSCEFPNGWRGSSEDVTAVGLDYEPDEAMVRQLNSSPKRWVVTYIRPGQGDLPVGNCRLHTEDCRYLRPTTARPYTGKRLATPAELASQSPCSVCG